MQMRQYLRKGIVQMCLVYNNKQLIVVRGMHTGIFRMRGLPIFDVSNWLLLISFGQYIK